MVILLSFLSNDYLFSLSLTFVSDTIADKAAHRCDKKDSCEQDMTVQWEMMTHTQFTHLMCGQ